MWYSIRYEVISTGCRLLLGLYSERQLTSDESKVEVDSGFGRMQMEKWEDKGRVEMEATRDTRPVVAVTRWG